MGFDQYASTCYWNYFNPENRCWLTSGVLSFSILSVFINLLCADSVCLYYGLRACLQSQFNFPMNTFYL